MGPLSLSCRIMPRAPKAAAKKASGPTNPLFEKTPKNLGIGGAIQPRKDLSRYVKWPAYVRLQRQRKILYERLKVPPAINQFTQTLDKSTAMSLFKLLTKYKPEDKDAKKERLTQMAAAKEKKEKVDAGKKPVVVKYGINHITSLVEQKKASLVVIAHDVDPIEIVVWLPALCQKMDVPYCIVKGKARLGTVVGKKTATALCLTGVRNEDKAELNKLVEAVKLNFNDRTKEINRKWGGNTMGLKSIHASDKKRKAIEKEEAKRMV